MANYNAMSDILATDLIKALWDDARREDDPARKAQLERDAATMEDVWSRSKYALAPTRDQMTAALGNASLNLADTLSIVAAEMRKVTERVGQIHTDVQNNDTLVSTFIESFQPQFNLFQQEARAAWEDNGTRLGKLETGQAQIVERLGQGEEERARIAKKLDLYIAGSRREEVDDHAARITALEHNNTRLDALEAFRADVQRRIDASVPEHEVHELVALLRQIALERRGNGNA